MFLIVVDTSAEIMLHSQVAAIEAFVQSRVKDEDLKRASSNSDL